MTGTANNIPGSRLPPELLQAIGALIVTASAVDQQVAFQILRLISPVHMVLFHAWPVVAGMDFRVKIGMVKRFAAMLGPEFRTAADECCHEMLTLYQHRNRLAHSVFTGLTRRGHGKFVNFSADQKTGMPGRPFVAGVSQITEWGRQLFVWSHELEQRLSDLGVAYNPPTQDDVATEPLAPLTGSDRPATRVPRTKRRKPSSPPR